jgi:hypothetical protein
MTRNWLRNSVVFGAVVVMALLSFNASAFADPVWHSDINQVWDPYDAPQPGYATSTCSVGSANGAIYGAAYAKFKLNNWLCGDAAVQVIYADVNNVVHNGAFVVAPNHGPTIWFQSYQSLSNIVGGNYSVYDEYFFFTVRWQTTVF